MRSCTRTPRARSAMTSRKSTWKFQTKPSTWWSTFSRWTRSIACRPSGPWARSGSRGSLTTPIKKCPRACSEARWPRGKCPASRRDPNDSPSTRRIPPPRPRNAPLLLNEIMNLSNKTPITSTARPSSATFYPFWFYSAQQLGLARGVLGQSLETSLEARDALILCQTLQN